MFKKNIVTVVLAISALEISGQYSQQNQKCNGWHNHFDILPQKLQQQQQQEQQQQQQNQKLSLQYDVTLEKGVTAEDVTYEQGKPGQDYQQQQQDWKPGQQQQNGGKPGQQQQNGGKLGQQQQNGGKLGQQQQHGGKLGQQQQNGGKLGQQQQNGGKLGQQQQNGGKLGQQQQNGGKLGQQQQNGGMPGPYPFLPGKPPGQYGFHHKNGDPWGRTGQKYIAHNHNGQHLKGREGSQDRSGTWGDESNDDSIGQDHLYYRVLPIGQKAKQHKQHGGKIVRCSCSGKGKGMRCGCSG